MKWEIYIEAIRIGPSTQRTGGLIRGRCIKELSEHNTKGKKRHVRTQAKGKEEGLSRI